MPKNKDAYTRYRLIDEALKNKQKPYPPLSELADKCGNMLGKRISESTIQKDIYAMRFDEGLNFFAPIDYHKAQKGYYYTDPQYSISKLPLKQEDLYALEFAAGMLRQFKDFPILQEFDNTIGRLLQAVQISRSLYGTEITDIIQVEKPSHSEGTNHLEKILKAITDPVEIIFYYHNFSKAKTSQHKIQPYLVREYRNRWYLTGYSPTHERILTFGLDRISNLHVTRTPFTKKSDFDARKFFYHSFGITVNDLVPVKVELSFTPLEGLYIKAQPIHHTQKIIKDNKKEFRISINVIPSHELSMQLLSYGENVKIIKPLQLKNEIQDTLKKALKNYSK
ncbi:MAG: WYL domain-containing protein [Bacteroidetes bacterium]|nr:MAG: WYL domain-containing protein [Bacteroidota bacterium]